MLDNACPPRSAADVVPRSKVRAMVMSVTCQIIFPFMSDARAPAMDIQMTGQDAGMPRSFRSILYSAILMSDNGYSPGNLLSNCMHSCILHSRKHHPRTSYTYDEVGWSARAQTSKDTARRRRRRRRKNSAQKRF